MKNTLMQETRDLLEDLQSLFAREEFNDLRVKNEIGEARSVLEYRLMIDNVLGRLNRQESEAAR